MNKNQDLLLQDYLKDRSDTRLSIFVSSVNPSFKLTKGNKEHVKLLIADWESDKSKLRLKNISLFLSADSDIVLNKKSATKKNFKLSKIENETLSDTDIAYREANQELKELVDSLKENIKDKEIVAILKPQIADVERRIDVIARKKDVELASSINPEQEERKILIKIFGDPTDPSSLAHRVLNCETNAFKLTSIYNPEVMIKRLFSLNYKEYMEYNAGIVGQGVGNCPVWLVRRGAGSDFDQGAQKI